MSALSSPEIAIESSELHVGQLAVAQSEARFKVLVAGRRWLKTRLVCRSACTAMWKGSLGLRCGCCDQPVPPFLQSQLPRGQG